MIAELLRQMYRIHIVGIPARIPATLQTFQYQLCACCSCQSLSSVFLFCIYLNFNSLAIGAVGGGAGNRKLVLQDSNSKPCCAICLVILI